MASAMMRSALNPANVDAVAAGQPAVLENVTQQVPCVVSRSVKFRRLRICRRAAVVRASVEQKRYEGCHCAPDVAPSHAELPLPATAIANSSSNDDVPPSLESSSVGDLSDTSNISVPTVGLLVLAAAVVGMYLFPSLLDAPFISDIVYNLQDVGEWVGEKLFSLGQAANGVLLQQLSSSLGPASLGVVFGAGLLTSFSPCTLSVLPLTVGYIAGYDSKKTRTQVIVDATSFSLGLATTLAGMGVVAASVGKAYSSVGPGLPIAVSCIAIAMGLNLLDILPLRLPSFFDNVDVKKAAATLPSPLQSYLAGFVFAFVASPCSTPVRATLLAYVASSQDVVLGGGCCLCTPWALWLPFSSLPPSPESSSNFSPCVSTARGLRLQVGRSS
eukprot:TRINITY_DN1324_c0_g1_i3.p1 TRINITY_DN1324_c0_g1~~TRINITY_DN1324_c0_g1_i3.p1  ORF type:complete len:403 (+),score=63.89 TRINITY_DN1324_c0_g1_i3:49-1209(+)